MRLNLKHITVFLQIGLDSLNSLRYNRLIKFLVISCEEEIIVCAGVNFACF